MSDRNSSTLSAQFVRERSILRNVYLWMTGGLALTGIVARLVSTNQAITQALYSNPILLFLLIGVELLMVIVLSSQIQRLSAGAATALFIGYSGLNGVTLSFVFLIYTQQSIGTVFFITAATFGGMSLYALTTKRDLSTVGHYAIMGLWGVLIASLVNLFIRSEALYYLISYIGVAVFLALTAYDTQIIKRWNEEMSDSVDEQMYVKISIIGALKLYLDFVNLFLFFLRIFGRRR
jgi:FtsH-binding integral membrane protein